MPSLSDYIKEFKGLKSMGFYSMQKIEFWLLKYSVVYYETLAYQRKQDFHILEEGLVVNLPSFWLPTDEAKFINLYKSLELISEYHRNEILIYNLLDEYDQTKNTKITLKSWFKKNKTFTIDKYASFITDYLDYDENNNEEHLMVYVDTIKELDIYILKDEFKSTIRYLKIINNIITNSSFEET